MEVYSNGIRCFCIPDCSKCRITDENPLHMNNCPIGYSKCDGDCDSYYEDYSNSFYMDDKIMLEREIENGV